MNGRFVIIKYPIEDVLQSELSAGLEQSCGIHLCTMGP